VALIDPAATIAVVGPWVPRLHPVTLAVLAALVACYVYLARGESRPSRRQCWAFVAAMAALAVAESWPLEDLSAHWSLTALVLQRLLLVLVVAPMLLLSIPAPLAARLTRPRAIDATVAFVSRPPVAVILFTAIAVGTLLTPAVAAQSSSSAARAATDALLIVSGFVLWSPVVTTLPGASRPSPLGRAVYLFVQSVIPGFPSVIFIFSHHPLYRAFAHVHAVFGLSPLVDQQLAGVVAKVATLPILWSVAWVILSNAHLADREGLDTEPLTWAEVQRQLERVERAERSGVRRASSASSSGATGTGPPSAQQPPSA
jgi:cytochrome c oxidase assembly factor CtaG